jgi:spore cortex biosynthesis protein YabQ
MNELIKSQLFIFLWSIVLGIGLAVTYDILRIIRRVIPHNKTVVGVEDVLFWMIASVIMFGYVFKSNSGVVRGFFFIGVCLGAVSYLKLVSHYFTDSLSRLINFILSKFLMLGKLLLKPIIIIIKPIYFLLIKLLKGFKKKQRCLTKKTRRLVKEIRCIIYKI